MRQRQQYLNMLRRDKDAAHLVGMPWEHAEAFMRIARSERCVISSRQLGRVCTGLMRGGYDTKGFRIKSKSCDFGPMAGFICADERFHKKGASYNATQKKDIQHALHGDSWDTTNKWRSGLEHICLTETRLNELLNWADASLSGAKINATLVTEGMMLGSVATPVAFNYVLRQERRHGDLVWAIYYTDKVLPRARVLWRSAAWEVMAGDLGLRPMMALTNPYPPYPAGHYKNCCTGDYDLFGVWPHSGIYQPLGEDRRISGMSSVNTNTQIITYEDKRAGNLSNRVHTVAQLINSVVNIGEATCRNVINHSDEAGRPFISGIDDHVIAFIPGDGADYIVGVESPGGVPRVDQWQAFFGLCLSLRFTVIVNAHWQQQLKLWGLEKQTTMGDARGWRPGPNSPARLR
jgi:hypothetical protein